MTAPPIARTPAMRWQAAPSAAPGISVIDLTYAQVLPHLNLLPCNGQIGGLSQVLAARISGKTPMWSRSQA